MKLGFISDTHEMHDVLTEQLRPLKLDVLIHCGDFTGNGRRDAVQKFADWCGSLRSDGIVENIFVVAGNHDILFDASHPNVIVLGPDAPAWCRSELGYAGVIYLQDRVYDFNGVRFYGSPWTPRFYNWAFQLDTEEDGEKVFNVIPHVDVLVTHGPPFGVRDRASDGHACGSRALLRAVDRLRPKVHAFGHIHEGYGVEVGAHTTFVNASTCTGKYKPINPPIVLEI